MAHFARPSFALISVVLLSVGAHAQTFTRVHDDVVMKTPGSPADAAAPSWPRSRNLPCCATPAGFDWAAYAWHNQPGPEGGTLSVWAAMNPALINSQGVIAFMAYVDGIERNQGIFIADGTSLTPIAIGCGGGGGSGSPGDGCGDPAPIGGTFSGFFAGTVFAPPINDAGDVLFLADVDGGSAPRGLFLYQGGTGQIIKIAAVGDPSPLGGTLSEIGPGSLNNNGEIVFLAKNSGTQQVHIMKWAAGTITKHVAVADSAPGGGSFALLAGESYGFADGTWIPIGAVPGINNAGQVSFFGIVQGGLAERGLFVTTGGVHEWYVKRGEASPAGGTYDSFWGPHLNDGGEIAFFADINLGGGQYTSAWCAGSPASGWRKVLAFHDEIGGRPVWGLAVSRNPMRPIDDCGNMYLYCALHQTDGSDRDTMLLCPPDGAPVVLAQQGDPTGFGGSFGGMNAWPSSNDFRQSMLSSYTPGTPGAVYSTHFVLSGRLPGDLDADNDVDLSDLARLLSTYGATSGATYADGDLDGDGDVDLTDLAALLTAYGTNC